MERVERAQRAVEQLGRECVRHADDAVPLKDSIDLFRGGRDRYLFDASADLCGVACVHELDS